MTDRSKMVLVTALALLILLSVPGASSQDGIIDPATLQINAGSSYIYHGTCTQSCGPGGELHSAGNSFTVNQNQGGPNSTLVNPVLILLGIAGNSNTAPTLVTGNSNGSYTVLGTSGLITSGTVWGVDFSTQTTSHPIITATSPLTYANMNSGSGSSSAYDILGLKNTGAFGQIWTNWSGAYTALMGTSSVPNDQFQLFAYAIYLNPNITGNNNTLGSVFQVQFNNLAKGTFIIAFGCQGVTDTSATCPGTSSNPYTTPFTEAGFVTDGHQVPEPASLLLFGSGLLAAAGVIRRRRNR